MYIISLCNRTEAWAGHGFVNLGQEVRTGLSKEWRLECGEKSIPLWGKNIPGEETACTNTSGGNRAWHSARLVLLECLEWERAAECEMSQGPIRQGHGGHKDLNCTTKWDEKTQQPEGRQWLERPVFLDSSWSPGWVWTGGHKGESERSLRWLWHESTAIYWRSQGMCSRDGEWEKSGPLAVYLTTTFKQSSFKNPSYKKVTLYSQSITVDPQHIHKDCLFAPSPCLGLCRRTLRGKSFSYIT